tara:strand:- start:366 stop:608 length:243 start_codon:yes stop_codon:yes gene_type:complete
MDKRFQVTDRFEFIASLLNLSIQERNQRVATRNNLEVALRGLKKQLVVTNNPSEISRIEEEITELQKYLTFGTRKEKKWS